MLSVCVITKNEEKFIRKCLDSVRDIASEIIIVDALSSDNTIKIASLYTDKIFQREWDHHFSNARNFALENATHEWVLFIDADEYLIGSAELADLLKSERSAPVHGYLLARQDRYIQPDSDKPDSYYSGMVRLVRNHPEIRWRNSIHEEIHSAIEGAGLKIEVAHCCSLVHQVHEYGYEDLLIKQKRYLNMLDAELSEKPANHWLQFHKAKTLWFLERSDEARQLYTALIEDTRTALKIRVAALNHLAVLALESLKTEDALQFTEESIRLMPAQSIAYMIRFDVYYEKGLIGDALGSLDRVRTALRDCSYTHAIPGDLFQRKDLVCYKRGSAFFALQDYQQAEEAFLEGIRYDRQSIDNDYGLALLYAKTQQYDQANEHVDICLSAAPDWLDAQVLKEYLQEI